MAEDELDKNVDASDAAFSDPGSLEASSPGSPRSELAAQQRADAETAQINANQQAFNQYITIEQGAKQQQLALDHQRAIAGAAMIQSAFRNGGISDRSLATAFSKVFGQPVYGGQLVKGVDLGNGPETVFAMYVAQKDPQTGKDRIAPVAMLGSADMVRILKSAGLGDITNNLQDDIINNSYLGKWTDDQRAAVGVSRPSAPISTGTTVISGAGMRALRGEPRQRSRISTYATDGEGGSTFSYSGPETGFQTISVDMGTRRNDYSGKWMPLSSGPDGERYRNSKTGEVVNVPPGSSLREVLRGGSSERERIAQMNNDSREKRAQVTAEATKYKADMAKEIAEIRAQRQTGKEITGKEIKGKELRQAMQIAIVKYDNETQKMISDRFDRLKRLQIDAANAENGNPQTDEEINEEIEKLRKDREAGKYNLFQEYYDDYYQRLANSGKLSDKEAEITGVTPPSERSSGYFDDDNGNGGGTFKELTPEEFSALPPAEQAKYKQAWKAWRETQSK